MPETLLKKRKSQEKAREERSAELEKKKKVGFLHLSRLCLEIEMAVNVDDGDDTYQYSRLDSRVDAVAYFNHLSGLNRSQKQKLMTAHMDKPKLTG